VAPAGPGSMPTAAAVAAAAVTAKITAMDAVAQTSGNLAPPGQVIPKLGDSNGATPPPANIPPPGLATPTSIGAPGLITPVSLATAAVPPPVGIVAPIVPPPPPPSSIPMPPMTLEAGEQAAKAKVAALTEAQKKLVDEEAVQSIEAQENMKITGSNARHMVMQKLMRNKRHNVMVLRNMVGIEDLDEDLENEVTEECGKYGTVDRVIIYQEKQGEEVDAEIIVKIFVEFRDERAVQAAVSALNGRFFGGRVVVASAYDSDMFASNDLSG